MTEPVVILNWLNSILLTDPVLTNPTTGVIGGWYRDDAPVGVKSPYGLIRMHTASEDLTALDGSAGLIWVPTIFQVNLYDRVRGNLSVIDPLAQRVYQILHAQDATLPGGIVFYAKRRQILAGSERVGDAAEQYITQQFDIAAKAE